MVFEKQSEGEKIMHKNSRESYEQCKKDNDFRKMIWAIARHYDVQRGKAFTDREVKRIMMYSDMNDVRPKITKLIKDGLLKEVGTIVDPDTNRKVRKVTWCDKVELELRLF